MIQQGKFNTLVAVRFTSVGAFLAESEEDEYEDAILLPNKYVPDDLREGDEISVFIYTDSEDRLVATTRTPKIQRNEFAYLQCVAVSSVGAFLDWGLEKDLFVPFREQNKRMEVGRRYVVFLYLDHETDRLVASAKINRFLENEAFGLEEGQEVDLLVYEPTDLGFNAIVNNRYRGLLYGNELFRRLYPGDRLQGYIKRIREDNRVDLTLQKPGFGNIEAGAQQILDSLKARGGFLPLTDDSDPEEIYDTLKMSKKTFKRAVGTLYRQQRITIESGGIRLA